jgi:hypothetical protein
MSIAASSDSALYPSIVTSTGDPSPTVFSARSRLPPCPLLQLSALQADGVCITVEVS